ncbi:rRNA methyltransferase 3, mitochondrial-like [Bolinopsis microptera]|uniref:rRNA methyltransferase 3, mitochondrial-like n=1 Tax=Bolinopsis microptera TaxID=2820187 RepID=UPI003078E258
MKLVKIVTQHCRRSQVCCCNIRQRGVHNSAQNLYRYDGRNAPINYPEKSLYVKKHLYDAKTHKEYADAMSFLKAKRRKGIGVFLENIKMISDVMKQGQTPSHIFYVKDAVLEKLPTLHESTKTVQITDKQMARLTEVTTPQGIMAVFDRPAYIPPSRVDTIPLIIYLDQVGNPGNLGTIIRSAAGAACSSVITSPNSADAWLPATLRASAAANYLIPLHERLGFNEVLETLPPDWNICLVESTSENSPKKHPNSLPYYEADFTQPTVMVFGQEAGGLSAGIRDLAVKRGIHNIIHTYIPTIPELDSLNVSMAATVLIYEMAKQQSKLVKRGRLWYCRVSVNGPWRFIARYYRAC